MPIGKTRPKTNEEKIEKIKNVYKAKYKLNKLGVPNLNKNSTLKDAIFEKFF